MLSLQCDLRVVNLGPSVYKPQMAGLSGQTMQDGPTHRIFAPTSTPLSAQISRKKDIGTVIHARHPALVKTPSTVKVNPSVVTDRICVSEVSDGDLQVACVD